MIRADRPPAVPLALSLALLSACAAGRPGPPGPGVRTRVVLLGTGTPNADPERSGPSLAVVVDETAYLVDAGPGVVRRAAAAHGLGIEALDVERIEHVFVTHLHSDHTLGLPDLVFSPWVLERDQPLQVFGPPGLRDMTRHVQTAWAEDVRIRIDGLEPANTEGYKTVVHELAPGLVHQDERVSVYAFRVPHGSFEHAFGYRFETPDRVVVVSGDTAPSEALVEAAEGCDVLVHEVYSAIAYETLPDEWKTYHASFHTSTVELADIARRARPKLLVLTHQLFWGQDEDDLVAEIRTHYDGPVVSGRDLDVF
jgi:ribonuclease BN (tRNA processing enzyme)